MPKKQNQKRRAQARPKPAQRPMSGGAVAVALDNVMRTRRPRITHRGDLVVVQHREYVGDVITDPLNVYAYAVYVVNPADTTTFPWLSAFANRFESFRFLRHDVEFRSFSATTTSGQVIIAIDYDSKDDTDTATKTQLLNTGNSVDGPMWSNFIHHSSTADLTRVGPWRFVDQTASAETSIDRLSSAGNLFVATTPSNGGGSVNVGELWIEYEVEFKTPVLHTNGGLGNRAAFFTTNAAAIPGTANALQAFVSGSAFLPSSIGNATLALVTEGNAFGVKGPPALPAANFVLPSNVPVTTGNALIAAISDFAGTIYYEYVSSSSTPSTANLASAVFTFVRQAVSNSGSIADTSLNLISSSSSNQAGNSFGSFLLDVIMPKGTGLFVTLPSATWPAGTDFTVEALPTPSNLAAYRKFISDSKRRRRTLTAQTSSAATSSELDLLREQFVDLASRLVK